MVGQGPDSLSVATPRSISWEGSQGEGCLLWYLALFEPLPFRLALNADEDDKRKWAGTRNDA
jgi:hypothetical protein